MTVETLQFVTMLVLMLHMYRGVFKNTDFKITSSTCKRIGRQGSQAKSGARQTRW